MERRWHALCQEPAADPLPAPPTIATTPAGRPEFDRYPDPDCGQLAHVATCDQPDDADSYACRSCLGAPEAEPASAVCVPLARRGCVPVAHGPGCIACVAAESRAKACCLGLPIDCRLWPFEGNSGPGELCARHADCEAGLVCKAPPDEARFGLCTCPEQEAQAPDLDACLWERAS